MRTTTRVHHPKSNARYRNALIGLAAGDAWGFQVEFTPYSRMPSYPVSAPGKTWRISDDTQMTLAVHQALGDVQELDDIASVTTALTNRFLAWEADPDNNRAPGRTCLSSLAHIRAGAQWFDIDGAIESAGCGAVMRLTPAAFAPSPYWLGLTALQALITHKHPRAVVPALLLADAIRNAPTRRGRFLEHAMRAAADIYNRSSEWLRDDYLAQVLAPITRDVTSYLVNGLDDRTVDMLIRASTVLDELGELAPHEFGDPCSGIGAGWESASATALAFLVADLATAPRGETATLTGPEALGWAATSDGDSDSIASIAGALIGAAHPTRNYWSRAGLKPRFEPRYTREIRDAVRDSATWTGAACDG